MAADKIPFVASSHLRDLTYDPDTSELIAVFDNGSYSYSAVPADVANGFTTAPSAGVYLRQNIVGQYAYKKL